MRNLQNLTDSEWKKKKSQRWDISIWISSFLPSLTINIPTHHSTRKTVGDFIEWLVQYQHYKECRNIKLHIICLVVPVCYRNSRLAVFYKKGALKNFTKFTRKHLQQSLIFNKVAGLRPATLSKKRLWHTFLIEHLRWLLLLLMLNQYITTGMKMRFMMTNNWVRISEQKETQSSTHRVKWNRYIVKIHLHQ